jgi:DNA-binding NarL/FixJ family response regulator
VLAVELPDDTELILDCIEAGVSAYTLRGASAAEVAEAISGVRGNRANSDPRITAGVFARLAALADQTAHEPARATPVLTPRELEVLHHLSLDRTNKEIAVRMVIEVRTVKHHVHSILQKLKLRHRWDAVRLARERGWLDVDPRSTG